MAGRNVDLYAGEDHAGYVISAAPTAGKTKYKTKHKINHKIKKDIEMKIEDIIEISKEAGSIRTTAVRPKIMEKSGHANFRTETDGQPSQYK